jgi:hypothetical protein
VRDALLAEDGTKILPRIGNPLEGNAKNQFVTVTKQGHDYLIDYDVQAKLNGFARGTTSITTDEDLSSIRMSMQIRISAQDLQQGNVTAYQVSRPPSYDLHVAIDPGTMDRQMTDNGF